MIADCYRSPIRLEDAAATIYLSPWHFQREFQRAFGESPHAFVTRLRISLAKELLATTSLSVMEVCLEIGFQSLGSFTSLFTREVGISPARYRRQARRVISVSGLRDVVCVPFCFASALFTTPSS